MRKVWGAAVDSAFIVAIFVFITDAANYAFPDFTIRLIFYFWLFLVTSTLKIYRK